MAKREAEYHRTGVYGIMHAHYDHLVETKVISEESLCQQYLKTSTVTNTTRELVQDELKRAARQPCNEMIHMRYWTGADAIRVTALWLRQPIIVVDIMENGDISAQIHALAQAAPGPTGPRETIRTELLSHAQLEGWL